MKARLITMCAALAAVIQAAFAQQWAPAGDRIKTRWAEEVSPASSHPEYPRPQMVRKDWKSLNGLWDYSITGKGDPRPATPEGSILVPFCIESSLSGVMRTFTPQDVLWYSTTFTVPGAWKGRRILLNCEAVDWRADVFVNDVLVGSHTGGYTHFSFDVTPYLKNGANSLVVKVQDSTDDDFQPRGKQVKNPNGIWYTAVSGIWQSVWLEPVQKAHVADFNPVFDRQDGNLEVSVETVGTQEGDIVKVALLEGGIGYDPEKPAASPVVVAEGKVVPGGAVLLPVKEPRLWSPDSPYLYGLEISILRGGKVIDKVDSYTALRSVEVFFRNRGTRLLGLNGAPIFQFGPLDQGWWPDGLYTAPTDEALAYDVQKTKDFGFNMIRKHIKVEPSRWFYHCDRIGIVVWQDMPSFAGSKKWGMFYYGEGEDFPASEKARANYFKEWGEIIDQVKKFQCVVVWVPFNEAWSQFETARAVEFTRAQDPTRLINQSSGGNWEQGVGDILDNHHYPYPKIRMWDSQMINVLGEYGGIGLPLEGHLWQADRNWGYVQYKDGGEVLKEYSSFADQLVTLLNQGLSGAVYTQTTDVEGEVNGLMTYDRKVIKMDESKLREVNQRVIRSMPSK